MRDKSDLSSGTVKIDYETLKTVVSAAIGAHHLLMEDYKRRCDDALEQIYRETYLHGNNADATQVLHSTIAAKSNAEYLLRETEYFAKAVALQHIVLGALNRENVTVVATPYKKAVEETEELI